MGRIKTIAGHFKKVVEKQPITIRQNRHELDENGVPKFAEDNVTPIMKVVEFEELIDVENVIWVDQVSIPFTPEEEAARDVEEEIHECEKLRPLPLTDRQEMDLLLEEGPEAVKAKRAEYQKSLEDFLNIYNPLIEKFQEKHLAVVEAAQRGN